MKALTVKQPWASLIACGRKTIELRTWRTQYRGEMIIGSSKVPMIEPFGCAVALVNLVDIREAKRDDWKAACYKPIKGERRYAWVFENIRPVKPVSLLGNQTIYDCSLTVIDLEIVDKRSPEFRLYQGVIEKLSKGEVDVSSIRCFL